MENETRPMNSKLRLFLDVLLFGSIWGLLETSLGTLLHLSAFSGAGIFLKTSIVMVTIAGFLMAMCYKRTRSLLSIIYMGLIAAAIKFTAAFIIGFNTYVYTPAMYIVIESLAMTASLAVFKPDRVLSPKTLATFVLANTTYQFSYIIFSGLLGGTNAFASMANWEKVGVKYLFTYNGLAILYTFAIGGIAYGVMKALEKAEVKVNFNLKKVVFSPITASIAFAIAIAVTLTFTAFF